MMTATISSEICRLSRTKIDLGNGLIAVETYCRGMEALEIHKGSKIIRSLRGSSLRFSDPLTDEDKSYLAALANR